MPGEAGHDRGMYRPIALAALAFCTIAPLGARALPGQSLADFDSWVHKNATLHGISGEAQLDGTIDYTVTIAAGPSTATYVASSDKDETAIVRESILLAAPDDYRLDQHREVGARLLSAVYGGKVADDFRDAKVAKSNGEDPPTVAMRGALYGYEISGARLTVRALADFDIDLATL